MIEAVFRGQVIARSDQTVFLEGNHYFPPVDVDMRYLHRSGHRTLCPWKGVATYYTVLVDGFDEPNAAWTYRRPRPPARQIKKHIAFWRGVEIVRR